MCKNLTDWILRSKNVARDGIEPPTRRFLVSYWCLDYVSLSVVN